MVLGVAEGGLSHPQQRQIGIGKPHTIDPTGWANVGMPALTLKSAAS